MHPLRQLAALYGVQTAYNDVAGRRQSATSETLLRVLAALGAPLERIEDAADALRAKKIKDAQWLVPPVLVAWQGRLGPFELVLESHDAGRHAAFELQLESGGRRNWSAPLDRLPETRRIEVDGRAFVARQVPPLESSHGADRLPLGYHRLAVDVGTRRGDVLVLSAPDKTWLPEGAPMTRTWGLFAPVYALHGEHSWGGGTLAELEALWQWASELGGGMVATLPLLAAFLDEQPFEPSPYAPVSRMFWNEFYLDIFHTPEWERCAEARRLAGSADFQRQAEALRGERLVDYRQQAQLRRSVLELLAENCFADSQRRGELDEFVRRQPQLDDYARFRAVCQRQQSGWLAWPQRLRDGRIEPGDYDEAARRYHLYSQWITQQQIEQLSRNAERSGPGLYLDLPLGVNRDGYDTWHQRDVYGMAASGGAPPDAFFTKGQDWGFPPLAPQRLREQGYRHLIQFWRHHMAHAGVLRIDHVMGLHRLYWVPLGMQARQGAYVRYHADELYAILCIESHRWRTSIVGENLGTVPSYVNRAMHRHGVRQMYVLQYEINAVRGKPRTPVPRGAVASLNTHDMPTFAGYWQQQDLDDLHRLELFDDEEIVEQRHKRDAVRRTLVEYLQQNGWLQEEPTVEAVLQAANNWLAASPAEAVLINIEDLWLETQPQNMPGTSWERPNWRSKLRYRIEQLAEIPHVVEQLRMLTQLRSRPADGKSPPGSANNAPSSSASSASSASNARRGGP